MTLTKNEELTHWLHNVASGNKGYQDYVILPKPRVHALGRELSRLNKLTRDLVYVVLDGKYKVPKDVREAARAALKEL